MKSTHTASLPNEDIENGIYLIEDGTADVWMASIEGGRIQRATMVSYKSYDTLDSSMDYVTFDLERDDWNYGEWKLYTGTVTLEN